jgi:hypothetical protein
MTALTEERKRKLNWLRRKDPEGYREVLDVLFEFERRSQRSEYEDSFRSFVLRAWSEVDPTPLSLSPFHDVLIEHLEMVARGEIRSLIINAPPRTRRQVVAGVGAVSGMGMVPR